MDVVTAYQTKLSCKRCLEHLRLDESGLMIEWLHDHLFNHVLSFWERHALDDHGGLLTCISDSGAVANTDKWLWSQWRAVWVFSRVYNRFDSDSRWLKIAVNIANFCARNGWDTKTDGWALVLSQNGAILRGYESIYVDAFAVYGLLELYKASRDESYLRLAQRTANAALKKLGCPHDKIPHFPYPIPPGSKPHGIPMLWSITLAELGFFLKDDLYLVKAKDLSDQIFRDFYRPDRDLILESVCFDGKEFPAPEGTAVVPGHAIEDMWFQFHVIELLNHMPKRADEIFRLILRHLELGWDKDFGGLYLAVDADKRQPVGWNFPDAKLWWPHTEALYAVLLGWKQVHNPLFLDWYERLWTLCLERYVDWENGEWRQKLTRNFRPSGDPVGLPVKDPFHLPRSLMLQLELLQPTGKDHQTLVQTPARGRR